MNATELKKLAIKGLGLKREIENLQDDLKGIQEQLLPELRNMAGDKQSYQYPTNDGIVEFKRSDKVKVMGEHENQIKEILDGQFTNYFTESVEMKPKTKPIKDLLSDGDSEIGLKLRNFVTVESNETVSFRPA